MKLDGGEVEVKTENVAADVGPVLVWLKELGIKAGWYEIEVGSLDVSSHLNKTVYRSVGLSVTIPWTSILAKSEVRNMPSCNH